MQISNRGNIQWCVSKAGILGNERRLQKLEHGELREHLRDMKSESVQGLDHTGFWNLSMDDAKTTEGLKQGSGVI